MLEELAAEFGVPTAAVLARVTALEAQGALSGVVDDRGKFIAITPDELDAVAGFIKRRGRVSRAELVTESARLIRLSAAAATAADGDGEGAALTAGGHGAVAHAPG